MDNHSYIIFTDGGARGNPGPAAAAAVLLRHEPLGLNVKRVKAVKQFLGVATNNVAEYTAVILGLEEALGLGAEEVELRLDSELVGKQLKGMYKIKNPNMQKLFTRAWNLQVKLKKFTVTLIPREENAEADALVNEVLDQSPVTRN